MLNVNILSVVMLNVFILSVVMLNVVEPPMKLYCKGRKYRTRVQMLENDKYTNLQFLCCKTFYSQLV
jgi:hypothetical protein